MEGKNSISIRLRDNQSFGNSYSFALETDYKNKTISEESWDSMKEICNINTLLKDRKILTIPDKNSYENDAIFDRINDRLYTYNWVGVISNITGDGNSCRVEICSRFDKGDKQFFLLYLLCNVCGINVFDLDINSASESDYTVILILLFLMKISDAYGEGFYKEYVRNRYNDFAFKGAFDVNRHILLNNPFVGRTAYSVREYSYDNDILCLIRQTMDYIMDYYPEIWNGYVCQSAAILEMIDLIETATPSYRMNVNYSERIRCQKEITNPLYYAYEDARKMALMILRESGQNIFDNKVDESVGVLIDISWLWEEFIAVKLLKNKGFIHLQTDGKKGSLKWAKDENWYPDFIEDKEGERRKVFDAKYKFWKWNKDEDVHQLLSYLFLSGGELCGIIYPSDIDTYDEDMNNFEFKELYAYSSFYPDVKAKMYRMPFFVPKSAEISFQKYCDRMNESISKWSEAFRKSVK
ncbi:MAG: McrC family protein [Lachnospiraceae bacterium]|nr:McrC family protein [Lachnospiraceae bacterium]